MGMLTSLANLVLDRSRENSLVSQSLMLAAVVICALGVVTSQNKSRKLFVELQNEKELAQKMEVEWGQLQLEQSTWATPARVERVAVKQLRMQQPENSQIRVVRLQPEGGARGK